MCTPKVRIPNPKIPKSKIPKSSKNEIQKSKIPKSMLVVEPPCQALIFETSMEMNFPMEIVHARLCLHYAPGMKDLAHTTPRHLVELNTWPAPQRDKE